MPYEEVIFSNHATSRLFERGLYRSDVERILRDGEVIRRYPDDTPYPSSPMLGWTEPDPSRWTDDFRTRIDESND